jgi:hypothetical protein
MAEIKSPAELQAEIGNTINDAAVTLADIASQAATGRVRKPTGSYMADAAARKQTGPKER